MFAERAEGMRTATSFWHGAIACVTKKLNVTSHIRLRDSLIPRRRVRSILGPFGRPIVVYMVKRQTVLVTLSATDTAATVLLQCQLSPTCAPEAHIMSPRFVAVVAEFHNGHFLVSMVRPTRSVRLARLMLHRDIVRGNSPLSWHTYVKPLL